MYQCTTSVANFDKIEAFFLCIQRMDIIKNYQSDDREKEREREDEEDEQKKEG